MKPVTDSFAVFSDIHGNLPALQAVLRDIDRRGIRKIYCLGDLVDFAPWPNEVIAVLRERRIPVVCGNHDRRVALDEPVTPIARHEPEEQAARAQAIALSKHTVSDENRRWLRRLPTELRFSLGSEAQCRQVLLAHGSPRSLSEYLRSDFPADQLMEMGARYGFDVLITGHTHRADVRKIENKTGRPLIVANCGAVGRIKPGEPQATWLSGAHSEGNLLLSAHAVSYDVAGVAQAIVESAVPDFYARDLYRNGMSCTLDLYTP